MTTPSSYCASVSVLPSIDQIMEQIFHAHREPRSPEYQAGVRAVFMRNLQRQKVACPHPAGSCAADAFYAGLCEGFAVFGKYCTTKEAI